MGLKDLIRKPEDVQPSTEANEEAAMAFIADAPLSATPKKITRKRRKAVTYVRTTFSLSKDLNMRIDKMVLQPRNVRISRSDVIRAGIVALQKLPKAERVELLIAASKSEPVADLPDDDEELT